VLAFITQGLSNKEIARDAYLSINSVKSYIRTAYRKIGVERRSQAVVWGMQHGFTPGSMRRVDPREDAP
jgi:DNA-binding CsgD family transcriptional regulator